MDDLISRRAALEPYETLRDDDVVSVRTIRDNIRFLPYDKADRYAAGYNDAKREIALSGEYERVYERGKADARLKGEWVFKGETAVYTCSNCKQEAYEDSEYGPLLSDFCPKCGADMRGGE